MSLRDRLHSIAQIWGLADKDGPVVQRVNDGMLPTAGLGDSGHGWHKVRGGREREVLTCPPPRSERHKYEEVQPGIWVKK